MARKVKKWVLPLSISSLLFLFLLARFFTAESHSIWFLFAVVIGVILLGYSFSNAIKLGIFYKDKQ